MENVGKPIVQLGLAATIITGTVAAVGAYTIGMQTWKLSKKVFSKFSSKEKADGKDDEETTDEETTADKKKGLKKIDKSEAENKADEKKKK